MLATRRNLITGIAPSLLFGGALLNSTIAKAAKPQAPGTIFSQPHISGITPQNFSAAGQVPPWNPVGIYYLHSNQADPYTGTTGFTPVAWDVTQTGITVPQPSDGFQMGIVSPDNVPTEGGTIETVAQIYNGMVGAYLFSPNLINNSPGQRMMITPQYQFNSDAPIFLFADPSQELLVNIGLQVPTAVDFGIPNVSNAYVKLDLLFIDQVSGGRVSMSYNLFENGANPKTDGSGFDTLTNTAISSPLVSPLGQLVTLVPNSAVFQNVPWTNFKKFAFTMNQAQFISALELALPWAQKYGDTLSLDPTNYILNLVHLNAELHYTQQYPTQLGWSMRNLLLMQQPVGT